jgi:hypothetical protein
VWRFKRFHFEVRIQSCNNRKETARDYESGAETIIMREDFESMDNKPLLKPAFAGAVDTVGGVILENIKNQLIQWE